MKIFVQSKENTKCRCEVQDTQGMNICAKQRKHSVDVYVQSTDTQDVDICAKYRNTVQIYVQSRGDTEGVCENKREAPALDLCQAVLRLALLHALMVIIILPVIIHVILIILIDVIFVSIVILVDVILVSIISNIMSGWSGAILKLLSIIVNLYLCIFVFVYLCLCICVCVFFIGKGSG